MATIEYYLYRAKFIKPKQLDFMHEKISPQDIFLEAIKEKPSLEVRQGYTWHIGNISRFSDSSGYFAVGRTTKAIFEKYNMDTGDFQIEEQESSPYTHCVFNATVGFLAIAGKSRLAPTSNGLAAKIQHLLSQTAIVKKNEIDVELSPINNPEDFLQAISSAYRILTFTATFTGPNPFDADEYFQRPLSVYLKEANGKKGKTQISGEDLNSNIVEAIARSTAATGNTASARIQRGRAQRTTRVDLKGNIVKRRYEEREIDPQKVLEDFSQLYNEVRGNG